MKDYSVLEIFKDEDKELSKFMSKIVDTVAKKKLIHGIFKEKLYDQEAEDSDEEEPEINIESNEKDKRNISSEKKEAESKLGLWALLTQRMKIYESNRGKIFSKLIQRVNFLEIIEELVDQNLNEITVQFQIMKNKDDKKHFLEGLMTEYINKIVETKSLKREEVAKIRKLI